ncbi:DUF3883 domain-containing protein [Mesorhizobium sp.]|uniref:DUF3883 domain-containing protein n=1 Tax=Mesorhizobium sp. TaxID=1871066 RepID=UPI00121B8A97|nr:DUF3883 domain-containing protein [Mesorhizobium sp.]TIL26385.1 MAG: DUF3883 domain-containing protein [Mesorhizobium sp.]
MSAFVAVSGIRRYLRDHPDSSVQESAESLRRLDADYAAADFEGGIRLHARFPEAIDFVDPRDGIRQGLTVLIEAYKPWWCRFFPYGRQRLATALSQDELQTFKSAGLFEDQPSSTIVEWWDAHAAQMRSVTDEKLNAQGRWAEVLSLDYERTRLASLGIDNGPRWVAIDDNAAGYDIQSYDPTEYGIKNRLVEVKSTQRTPSRIILTRGEWNAALKFGEAYFFYIWKLPSEELIVKSGSEMADHIPADCGNGRWTELEIEI